MHNDRHTRSVSPYHGSWPITIGVTLLAYLAAHLLALGRAPSGLANDSAEEALRGVRLLAEHRIEVITSVLGNSAETFHLYLVGAAARIFGASWAAVSVPTIVLASACVVLVMLAVRRLAPAAPPWVAVVAATSPWLFHYGQAGLRAAWAMVFAAAVALAIDRAERTGRARWWVAAGAMIGVSLYAYTACRVLPLAVAAVAAFHVYHSDDRRRLARGYALLAVAALVASVPNLVFAVAHPAEFLSRGAYVLPTDRSLIARNLLWTVLLPLHVPAPFAAISGPGHNFDGVACGLVAAVRPIDLVTAVAIARGLFLALRRRREPLPAVFLAILATGDIVLGVAGPSLTRLAIVLPAYLALAGLAFADLAQRHRGAAAAALAAVLLVNLHGYAVSFRTSAEAQRYFSPNVTALAERAGVLASAGRRVLCVVPESANTVRYFTSRHPERVAVAEFYRRPLVDREVPVAAFRPEVVLIDSTPRFDAFRSRLSRAGALSARRGFTEVTLDPR